MYLQPYVDLEILSVISWQHDGHIYSPLRTNAWDDYPSGKFHQDFQWNHRGFHECNVILVCESIWECAQKYGGHGMGMAWCIGPVHKMAKGAALFPRILIFPKTKHIACEYSTGLSLNKNSILGVLPLPLIPFCGVKWLPTSCWNNPHHCFRSIHPVVVACVHILYPMIYRSLRIPINSIIQKHIDGMGT